MCTVQIHSSDKADVKSAETEIFFGETAAEHKDNSGKVGENLSHIKEGF